MLDGGDSPVTVVLDGGELEVEVGEDLHMNLTGWAVPVCQGTLADDLLKELHLAEGRGTGIPKIRRRMRENGSPEARFDFDEERTYFRVTLPVHPRYEVLNALRQYERKRREERKTG